MSKFDSCVYFPKQSDGLYIYLLIYVDDMLITSKSKKEIQKLKEQLASEFEMKDLDNAQDVLKIEIRRDLEGRTLWLRQSGYIGKFMRIFWMHDSKRVNVIFVFGMKLLNNVLNVAFSFTALVRDLHIWLRDYLVLNQRDTTQNRDIVSLTHTETFLFFKTKHFFFF